MLLCMATGLLLTCSCSGNHPNGNEPTPNPSPAPGDSTVMPGTRDPFKWPFSATSIWNTPIGDEAEYVHAGLERVATMTVDEDYICLTPTEDMLKIYKSNAGWSSGPGRCEHTGELICEVPYPKSWEISPDTWDGLTPNAALAVLMPDGRTIKQLQPFAHCDPASDEGTATYVAADEDIYGEGTYGAHGGSELSAIGGTLRIHELTPTSGPIRHALKINLWGAKNLYYDAETGGYRWPATRADSYAAEEDNGYGRKRTEPAVKECRMGALLALPPSINIEDLGLVTEPAKILAQALQDYGAYVVDDTAWDVNAFITEWSPEGRFKDEFQKNWGFSFSTNDQTDWGKDLIKIFAQLHVVVNNTEATPGGGGNPRQPLAPPFAIRF